MELDNENYSIEDIELENCHEKKLQLIDMYVSKCRHSFCGSTELEAGRLYSASLGQALLVKGTLLMDIGRPDDACSVFTEVSRMNSESQRMAALVGLSKAFKARGCLGRSAAVLQELLRSSPNDMAARLARAELLYPLAPTHSRIAFEDMDACIAARHRIQYVLLLRARLFERLEQKDESIEDLQHILRLNPGNCDALKQLQRIAPTIRKRTLMVNESTSPRRRKRACTDNVYPESQY